MKKTVTVTIDRPLGTYHPEHKDLYYPINYGYVQGVMAPDGEEQDAYVVGMNEPLDEFAGELTAIIHRKNDIEDKWVVAPKGVRFSKEDVEKLVEFQEQYFDCDIEMIGDIKWLFFDMGSTLIDETDCYKSRIDFAVDNSGIDRKEFADKVYVCAKTSATAIKSAAEYYGVALPEWNNELERLYPNIESILQVLSGRYKLGIIANQSLGSRERLEKWGIAKYFDVIVASAEEGCAKPNKRIFEIALERAGCKSWEAMMIGDRLDNDISPAKEMGMGTVWVKQGFAKYQSISNDAEIPTFIIHSIGELPCVL